ncbi:MAG: GatB/YqeY domain-containing protein [Cytophagales bacterium]|nr:GatB/YqeY domain-containing protein [Cytophagales bacterium]MDW8384976.1 GatB/YqeY domain-containing protein [Flammeovirgaceae bacterium]
MSLKSRVEEEMKNAMKAKDTITLEALRAIKSKILLEQTSKGGNTELTEEQEVKLLQSLIKQRRDSIEQFQKAGRTELAEKELAEIRVIERFLPAQLSEDEVRKILQEIIARVGATSPKDMGKVMGVASKELAGKADNKLIADIVKSLLNP